MAKATLKSVYSLVVFFSLVPFINAEETINLGAASDFDFFYLAMQWPPATCSGHPPAQCKQRISNFTLHGLWPAKNVGPSPTYCNSVPFDNGKLTKAVINDLSTCWPDLLRGDNTNFWSREWQKHGTCSGLKLADYFKNSINLVKGINILKTLDNAGIRPDNKNYRIVDIKKAVKIAQNKQPLQLEPSIKCNVNTKGEIQLHEIRLCVNKAGKQFEKFQRSTDIGCGCSQPKIKFPSA
ncbi:extracellular ribonuclease LE [Ricinus communis]|uniref:Ribonuclease t2, putative n=1 Tax=Ricinus communis TaxID=3988 RepID=B9RH69_RICCO|nr:extracellular ribonuclease LE [Ricinus communis]EEF49431.1 ribonuclease t2, putative [Ricinus communis]|eukprot:XP_002512928.1 extracellular ribonuclease LE [Ricinus communis]